MTLAEFEAAFEDEVGPDLVALIPAGAVERWVNEGRTRIQFLKFKTGTITWDALDLEVDLPSDLVELSKVQPVASLVTLPTFERWGLKLVFSDTDGASVAGSARVWYRAYFPAITDVAASEMLAEADRACLSYALYRYFRLLSSNRLIYKRYATQAGSNAVQIEDLQDEATRHYDDFLAAQEALPVDPPSFYFDRL